MAITLRQLYEDLRMPYHLQCLAAETELDHVVSWAHMVEDARVAEFFWGNELAITSGCALTSEQMLLDFAEALGQHGCSAIVINVGKYIPTVPQSLIEQCNRLGLPLFTMPWNISMTALVKECCGLVDQSNREHEKLAAAALNAIQSPNDKGGYYETLAAYFDGNAGFTILAITLDIDEEVRRLGLHIAELRFHTALNRWGFQYLVFPYKHRYLLLLNQSDRKVTDEIARHLVKTYHSTYHAQNRQMKIHVGVGEPVTAVTQLNIAYLSACAADRRAAFTDTDLVCFREMGYYQLLYSLPSSDMMTDYYTRTFAPVLEYDKKHGGEFTETLCRYLVQNGSLQAVAEDMFTHRNTVNYRMGRIRELLDCPLNTHDECLPYLLAYQIAVILNKLPDYRRPTP